MNKVLILGRITKDIELKTTPAGVSVCSFNVAVNRRFAKDGQREADFIKCVAWRSTAECISKYFSKGEMIGIVGSLTTGKYEKGGQTHYTTDVIVDEMYFVDRKNKEETDATNDNKPHFAMTEDYMPIANDDLPF